MAALDEASPMATESTLPGTLTCVASLAGHSERVWHAAWSPDGRVLASGGDDARVKARARTPRRAPRDPSGPFSRGDES